MTEEAGNAVEIGNAILRPLGDRIIVKRLNPEEKTTGGIIIPDTVKEKPQQAEVLSIGSGRMDGNGVRHPVDVEVGDIILFPKHTGITINDSDYLALTERDILAVVGKKQ